jgi:inosose dehydratase
MTARIGINPLTWSNDDMPSLGADNSLETCLTQAREAGYAGVELGHKFPRDAATLGPILASHGLVLVSGWYSAHLLERDAAEEFTAMAAHLALLEAMGCEVMVLAEVTGCVHSDMQVRLSRRPHLPAARWAEFGSRMTELAKLMRAAGMRLAYHHHMGTVVQSGADVDHLMRHTGPEVELLLDTGHLTFASRKPTPAASHTCTARTCGARCWRAASTGTPASSKRCCRACSPCPATDAWTTTASSRSSSPRAIAGGGWWKPSRIPPSPSRASTRAWVTSAWSGSLAPRLEPHRRRNPLPRHQLEVLTLARRDVAPVLHDQQASREG